MIKTINIVLCLCCLFLFSCASYKDLTTTNKDIEYFYDNMQDKENDPPSVEYIEISPRDFTITEKFIPISNLNLLNKQVNLQVEKIPLSKMLQIIFNEYKVNYIFDLPEKDKDTLISLSFSGKMGDLLNTISINNGIYFAEEGEGNNSFVRVFKEKTYIFYIPSLLQAHTNKSNMISASGGVSSGISGTSTGTGGSSLSAGTSGGGGSSSSGGDLMDNINKTIKEHGGKNIHVDTVNGVITFTANSKNIEQIKSYIEKIKENMSMVFIDMLVAEVDIKNEFSKGIQWDAVFSKSGNSFISGNVNLGALSVLPNISYGILNSTMSLKSVVSFMEKFGKTTILQKPMLSVLNGFPAHLRVGREIPYVDTIKLMPVQVGGVSTVTQEVTFKNALEGFDLKIMPFVSGDVITLGISGQLNGVLDFIETSIGNDQKIKKPVTIIREIQNISSLKSGQILKIGGMITERRAKTTQGLPFAATTTATEILGTAQSSEGAKSELVILIKPKLIKFVYKGL